jgi:amino acid adenylation domain-containing protein
MTASQDNRAERLRRAIDARRTASSPHAGIPPRSRDRAPRLSEAQRSLWLVHQLEPASPAYTLASAWRVRGRIDRTRLEAAFNLVLSRHRLLRSRFPGHGREVAWIVEPHVRRPLQVVERPDDQLELTAAALAREAFDLESGPLVRMHLVASPASGERVLLVALHHILADEVSLGTLWDELAAAYEGRLSAEAAAPQYDDYVEWLEARIRGERDEQLEYWSRRLTPTPEILRLPFERQTIATAGASGRLLTRALDPARLAPIRHLAAAAGCTPFAVFAFAFRLLLDRYTGGQHVAVATPVSTRAHADAHTMVGYFLNPVVIGTRPDEDASVLDAVRAFGAQVRDDLAHAALSFSAVVEATAPPRQHGRHPVFQAMFVQRDVRAMPALGDCRLEPLPLDLGASKFDLTLFVTAAADAFSCAVEYRADRFDAVWMERLLDHYATLLGNLPRQLSDVVAAVEMLAPAERLELDAFAQGPPLAGNAPGTVVEQILEHARIAPDVAALAWDGGSLTYADLERHAGAIARALEDRGVRPGDRVGIFVERSPMVVTAIVGALMAGAAYVPLDPAYPAARTVETLADAAVAAVLSTTTLMSRVPQGTWSVIAIDALGPAGAAQRYESRATAGLPAYVLYTSGSTGRPKGVVVTHANLAASTQARFDLYDARPDRFLLVPSVAFDSSVAGIFWTLCGGGTLVVPTDEQARDARLLARLVQSARVTALLAVPSLYLQMLDVAGDVLTGLELAIVAGEPCPQRLIAEHVRRLPLVRLWNEYGPTEATVWATAHELTGGVAGAVPIGRPIPGVRVDVLDARGRPVPVGVPGVAWVSGPTVARGYWQRSELTSQRFVERSHGVSCRTGDVVSWRADGALEFLGREDEQLKIRGFRIEPGEIEDALRQLPDVSDAAVVAWRGSHAGAEASLVAFVRTSGGAPLSGWREQLAERLPAHLVPARLVALSELPRLPNGKLDRRLLETTPIEESPGAAILTPGTREETLIALFEGLLGRRGVRPTDNFFELGGHSLQVLELVLALERDFGTQLSAADVFQHPTVRELAARVDARRVTGAAEYRHLFPIQTSGAGCPFIIAVPDFFAPIFAGRFRGERPVYGLRGVSNRPEGNYRRWRSLPALGEELADEIARRFPGERTILAGYSFGATMAVEAARALERRGTPAARLYLIAPMALDYYHLGPLRVQLDDLRQPAHALTPWQAFTHALRSNHPLTRRPYARLKRRLVIQPWRRALALAGRARSVMGLPLTPRMLFADVRVERFRLHDAYRPAPIHTPTVIFNAAGTASDAAATWRPFFHGPLAVHETPDPHREELIGAARDVILRHMTDAGA